MFLFIFESIGTSELILVGIVALVLLGPRRLPEMARKAGKLMAEFRGTANEFKETWQREVNFEEEAKALNLKDDIDAQPIKRVETTPATATAVTSPAAPMIKEVDPETLERLKPAEKPTDKTTEQKTPSIELNDKKNWL